MNLNTDAKHTPGPFIPSRGVEDEPERWCVLADRGDKQYLLATIENGAPGDTLKTEGANARLFAASDDLLAACVAMKEARRLSANLFKPHDIEMAKQAYADAVRMIDAAIAKAQGASL